MNSVERVKSICKDRKIPISRLEKDLGFANGYISQLRKGVFPADRLSEIANYLSVSLEYLMSGAEEKKGPAILADSRPICLEKTYLRLAQGAQELGLDDEDVDNILAIYAKHKQKNQ